MIRVKMLKTAAGPDGVRSVGAVVELDAETALAYVESGAAAYVGKPGKMLISGQTIARATPGEPNVTKALEVKAPEVTPPATPAVEDPEELERQQMFKELVAGGTPEAEARALIWPAKVPDVERAVRTPPETAVAPAQRPPRRR